MLEDKGYDRLIDKQISAIARTGATHVAIETPHDEEFNPIINNCIDKSGIMKD